jgi:hypothetical protein
LGNCHGGQVTRGSHVEEVVAKPVGEKKNDWGQPFWVVIMQYLRKCVFVYYGHYAVIWTFVLQMSVQYRFLHFCYEER